MTCLVSALGFDDHNTGVSSDFRFDSAQDLTLYEHTERGIRLPLIREPFGSRVPDLISWSASRDDVIRHFFGVAAYHKRLDLPHIITERVLLDLGELGYVAEVWLNGRRIGILWYGSYEVDIT